MKIRTNSRILWRAALICVPAAVALWGGTEARACDCAVPRDRAAATAHILNEAEVVVFGRVLSARQTTRRRREGGWVSAPLVEARVKITRSIKGDVPQLITVESDGFDNGANCGIGDGLRGAHQRGETISLAFEKRGKTDRFYVTQCWSGVIEETDLPS